MTYLMTPNRISREMDKMFNTFGCSDNAECCGFSPRVNIKENEEDVTLTFEVPGVARDDIKVTVENSVLTVSGERKAEAVDEKATYVRNEIRSGEFSRSFTLPRTIDTDQISADYRNGLLVISLARKEEAKPKQIEVKVN